MALYVYDHGYRIQTPKDSLFPKKGVNSLLKSRHSHRSADTEDRLHADGEKFVIPAQEKQLQNNDTMSQAYTANTAQPSETKQGIQITAASIMVSPVHTITPDTTIKSAWDRMLSLDISHLIITEGDQRPLGLLSKKDLLKAGIDSNNPISTIYSKELIAATPETLVQDIAVNFIDNDINSIPVVDENDFVIGVICRTDLLRLLVSGPHLESWV
ncbi:MULTISPECIES: CBS domain-containing protein [unclassified Neptuniibacter]|uniref:CBS domain-containing protein n=1 Tax=unclassified Neptuniibacter TaxID=2630693 RepID=UPI0025F88F2B|nr:MULTISPECIES: CBS domain-containing protein [unclassified Neptuniibacter]|tara:strand:- start:1162 stop:1803 length:642 start_codon:yes stop_codon:yes gene_type:complete